MQTPQALLLVLSRAPLNTRDRTEFEKWYELDHAPARLRVDGINTARVYRERSTASNFLAYYDLESVETLRSPSYSALRAKRSEHERQVMATIPQLVRRVYRKVGPDAGGDTSDICGKILLGVWWSPAPGTESDFHAWYAEEHLPLLMEVPGWLRVRRYEQFEGSGPRFLALHDIADASAFATKEYERATNTPWRDRVVAQRREFERHDYDLWRNVTST